MCETLETGTGYKMSHIFPIGYTMLPPSVGCQRENTVLLEAGKRETSDYVKFCKRKKTSFTAEGDCHDPLIIKQSLPALTQVT